MDAGSGKFDIHDDNAPVIVVAEPENEAPLLVVAEDVPTLMVSEPVAETVLLAVEETAPPPSSAPQAAVVEMTKASSVTPPARPSGPSVEAAAHKGGPAISESILNALDESVEPGAGQIPPTAAVAAAAAAAAAAAIAHAPAPSAAPPSALSPASPQGWVARLPMIAIAVGCFASVISAAGLVVASRTIAHNNTLIAELAGHQAQMRQLETLITEVEALNRSQSAIVTRMERSASIRPLTAGEMHAALANMQSKLGRGEGASGNLTLLRDGQSELAERIGIMYRRMERMDEKLALLARGAPGQTVTVRKGAQ